ncbi:MAG: S41 family peptidase [Acidobacteriota bacterium]|nr:S41 family peptidase [Acidobacteriota bacterium]
MKRTIALLALALSLSVAALADQEPWSLWKNPLWKTGYRELTEEERVAGLSRVWSEVKYNFANFDLVPRVDWDAEYIAALPRVRAAKTTLEYYRVMQEMVARLHDGHTYLWPSNDLASQLYADVPVVAKLVEGKPIVWKVYDAANGIVPGDEIVAIDDVPAKTYADTRIRPYVFASTPQDADNRVYSQWLLSGADGSAVRLKIRDAKGKTREVHLTRTSKNLAPPRKLISLEVLEGNVGYLVVNSFNDDRLKGRYDELWPQIEKTSALIIDIRANGGGNTNNGYHILKTLTNKPFLGSKWRTRKYLPSYRAWNRAEVWDVHEAEAEPPDGERHYDKAVAVLSSERTFSAAEDFAVAFDAMDRGVFVGGPTGGSTGQPLLLDLPGGGIVGICTKRDQYPDGREFIGVGVQPDIAVPLTIADVRSGRDAVLEKALAAVRKR